MANEGRRDEFDTCVCQFDCPESDVYQQLVMPNLI